MGKKGSTQYLMIKRRGHKDDHDYTGVDDEKTRPYGL